MESGGFLGSVGVGAFEVAAKASSQCLGAVSGS